MNKNYLMLNKLKNAKTICLIAHIDPDTDALCSLFVFRDFLINYFKKTIVDIFAECKSVSNLDKPILAGVKLNPKPQKYDCAIILDCPNLDRVGKYAKLYNNAGLKVVIDHHATDNLKADIKIFNIVSSTCEIIYTIFKQFHYHLNAILCSRLYAGLICDTNNFSVGAITKTSYELAGACIKYINPSEIYSYYFLNTTLKQQKLFACAINNINSYEGSKILISHISKKESELLNLEDSDYTGISNRIAAITGSKIICFIHPKGNSYYVSMRAKQPYDVSKIALSHSGGGHVGAAAYLSSANLKQIENEALNELTKELKSKKMGKENSIF